MKILVAEDNRITRLILTNLLSKWGYEVTAVADGDEAWSVLTSEGSPRLVILDWMMPGREGPSICRDLRKLGRPGYFYIILLTALGQKGNIVEGIAAGADDYIIKPFEPEELRVRLRTGQRILVLEAELVASREAFRQQAMHDPLTGILSRRAILEVFERELAKARRYGNQFSIAIADIDHFKSVNDRYGHPAGDAVLVEVVRRIISTVRDSDAVGRLGGEEFLAILPETAIPGAVVVSERIRARVESRPVDTPAGPVSVTLSAGVAAAHEDLTSDTLMSRADKALYAAKNSGRNRVHVWAACHGREAD